MSETYERDFYACAHEQAALLRAGRLGDADIAHIAEGIDSMGKQEKRELADRLATKLDEAMFPTICPWSIEQMMDPDFWPL
jgi:hypothetical protein